MGCEIPSGLTGLTERLARVQAAFVKAAMARESAIAQAMEAGFSRGAVERAMEIITIEPRTEYEIMSEVSRLLEAAGGRVRVEALGLVQAPHYPKTKATEEARSKGAAARRKGKPRKSPYARGILHRQWLKGWDEADRQSASARP